MKNLVFAALLVGGLTQATGCIIVSDDDDTVDSSTFLVDWTLESRAGGSAVASTCAEAGVDTIVVVSQPTGGAEIRDLFDCVDGQGETAPLPLADYLVWTEAVDTTVAPELLVAQSFANEETLFDANPVATSFSFPWDAGFLELEWTLTDETVSPPQPLTCAEWPADGVSVLATQVGGSSTGYDEVFNCVDGTSAVTSFEERLALPVDEYTVVVSLLEGETVWGQSEPRTVTIDYGNEVEDLGNFDFADDGT